MSKSQKNDKRYRVRRKLKEEGKTPQEIKQILEADPETAKNPQPQDEPIISDSNPSAPGSEAVEVETHSESEPGIGGLFRRSLANMGASIDSTAPRRGRPSGSKANKDEFSSVVVSVVTLLVTFAKVDERVKPNTEEINIFSDRVTNILLRHFPINNKLSADAIDIIAIFAVGASWYGRVGAYLKTAQPEKLTSEQKVVTPRDNGNIKISPDDLRSYSPETAAFLDTAASHPITEE